MGDHNFGATSNQGKIYNFVRNLEGHVTDYATPNFQAFRTAARSTCSCSKITMFVKFEPRLMRHESNDSEDQRTQTNLRCHPEVTKKVYQGKAQ